MTADRFLYSPVTGFQWQTLLILGLGLFAFVMDTTAGLLFGKLACWLTAGPLTRSSAPVASPPSPWRAGLPRKWPRQRISTTIILMQAMGADPAGRLASVVAGGLLLALVAPV